MFKYSLANLTLSSDLEINYLPATTKPKIDLEIKFQKFNRPENLTPYHSWLNDDLSKRLNFYQDKNVYYLEYPDLISFCISDNQILCEKVITEDYHYLHLLTDQVIPLYISLTTLVLHASAFSYQDYQIILLGKSGSGKSTLVSKLYPLGKFISDDFLPIKFNEDIPQLIPTYPGIRLIGEREQKKVTSVKEKDFAHLQETKNIVIVYLDRDYTIKPQDYNLSTTKPNEVYQQLLTELVQLASNDKLKLLDTFTQLNQFIRKYQLMKLSYSDLTRVNLEALVIKLIYKD